MIDNAAAPALGMQLGGGTSDQIQRILPYLVAYNKDVHANTMVPLGLIKDRVPKKKYWSEVKLSRYFNNDQLKRMKRAHRDYLK